MQSKKMMKKLLITIGIATVAIYLFFALLPEITRWSLPTGGWDWLGYVGIIFGLVITGWGIATTIEWDSIQHKKAATASNHSLLIY